MRRIYALGAAALLGLGLYGTASAMASPVATSPLATEVEPVCPGDKIDVEGNQTSVHVVAPDGMVIVKYCVKAGPSPC